MKEENASLKSQVSSVESIQQLEKKYQSQLGNSKKILMFITLFVYISNYHCPNNDRVQISYDYKSHVYD